MGSANPVKLSKKHANYDLMLKNSQKIVTNFEKVERSKEIPLSVLSIKNKYIFDINFIKDYKGRCIQFIIKERKYVKKNRDVFALHPDIDVFLSDLKALRMIGLKQEQLFCDNNFCCFINIY